MSLESLNTLATLGTFVVIAATAVAALIQLRHARSSNQIAALTQLRDAFQSREFSEANGLVLTRLEELLKNPVFRYQLANRAARTDEFTPAIISINLIGNYFEDMGALMVAGLLDTKLVCTIYSSDITQCWERLEPVVAIQRRKGGDAVWENFEYAAMLAFRWIDARPNGAYPPNAPRLPIRDEWLEADRAYAPQ
jgi:hypothetical protein